MQFPEYMTFMEHIKSWQPQRASPIEACQRPFDSPPSGRHRTPSKKQGHTLADNDPFGQTLVCRRP